MKPTPIRLLLLGLLTLSLLSTSTAMSQSTTSSSSNPDSSKIINLNLEQALELALTENPTIKVAGLEIEKQRLARKEAAGNLMPNISASGSYTYNYLLPVMFLPENSFIPGTGGGAMRMGFSNSFSGGVSLALPLYMPTIYKSMQLTDQQISMAVESARGSKISLANQVKKTFYGILMSQSSLEVISDNIKLAQKIVDDSQNAYDQEMVSEYDLITARVQLSNLQPTLLAAENSLRNLKLMFNMLLDLPSSIEVTLEGTLTNYTDQAMGTKLNSDTTSIDLVENSDLKVMAIQRTMLEKQFELQRAARLPNLSAIAQYQTQSQSNDFKIGEYRWPGTGLVGLQLKVPIFAGLTNVNKERQTKNSISQLDLQYDYRTQSLDVEARTAQSDMLRASEQTHSSQEALILAQKGYSIAQTRYEIGAGTITDLNSAQVSQLQAQINFLQAIYDYMTAKADYEKILGKY